MIAYTQGQDKDSHVPGAVTSENLESGGGEVKGKDGRILQKHS